MVLDADALYWLAQDRAKLANLGSNLVLTPHPMEMSRLLGLTLDQVEEDRFGAARSLAGQCLATVVLKGPGTVVSAGDDPLARAYLSPFSVANLAVGGSGDVLSGVLGALLARSISPLPAACLGVYWHGLAGQIMSENFPYRGNLASEIATALPRALTEWMDADS
jgi:NAD(P)H-hydrate epimerase